MAESCASCKFYVSKAQLCRRYPPTPIMVGHKQAIGGLAGPEPVIANYFPQIPKEAWCGEWREAPKEALSS